MNSTPELVLMYPRPEQAKSIKKKLQAPLLHLSHTCRLIREEFRPLWLRAHIIDLSDLSSYMLALILFVRRKDGENPIVGDTTQGAMTLKVGIAEEGFGCVEVLQVLKMLAGHPGFSVNLRGHELDVDLGPLNYVLMNREELWFKRITGDRFTEVYMNVRVDDQDSQWMGTPLLAIHMGFTIRPQFIWELNQHESEISYAESRRKWFKDMGMFKDDFSYDFGFCEW